MIVPTFCTGEPAFAERPVSQHRETAISTGWDHLGQCFVQTFSNCMKVMGSEIENSLTLQVWICCIINKDNQPIRSDLPTVHVCVFIFELAFFSVRHNVLYIVVIMELNQMKCAVMKIISFDLFDVFSYCKQSYMSLLEKHINDSDNGWSPAWHSLCTWWLTVGAFWDT